MKLRVVWRKVSDYVRYDLKEIAFPSSLPDPPHFKKRRKLTWKERYLRKRVKLTDIEQFELSLKFRKHYTYGVDEDLYPQSCIKVLKEASRLYCASWVRDIGPDLRPNDYKKNEWSEDKPNGVDSTNKQKEPSTLEDLAIAARGGMEALRPALQRVYMTRASAYRDGLKSFIQGYQEGIKEVMEKKEEYDSQQREDIEKKEDIQKKTS